jgi:hypothetical protein
MSEDDDGFDECYCGQVRQCDDWVACTQCERWMHLGCTEFDTVEEAEKDDTYKCPRCKNGGIKQAVILQEVDEPLLQVYLVVPLGHPN